MKKTQDFSNKLRKLEKNIQNRIWKRNMEFIMNLIRISNRRKLFEGDSNFSFFFIDLLESLFSLSSRKISKNLRNYKINFVIELMQ